MQLNKACCLKIKPATHNSTQTSVETFGITSYRYRLLQHIAAQDKEVHYTFFCDFLSRLEDDEIFTDKIAFNDEAIINLSENVN
jgi:hypothetical protein